MASALAVNTRVQGAGFSRLSAPPSGPSGVYRLARVNGRRAAGVSGTLFLREDRGCVLRLVLPTADDQRLVRLMRGIWWPVPVGIKTLTSDGSVGVWPVGRNSVTVRFPLAVPGATRSGEVTEIKFVRVL